MPSAVTAIVNSSFWASGSAPPCRFRASVSSVDRVSGRAQIARLCALAPPQSAINTGCSPGRGVKSFRPLRWSDGQSVPLRVCQRYRFRIIHSTFDIGAAEISAAEVRADEVSVSHVGATEVRASKVGAQAGISRVRTDDSNNTSGIQYTPRNSAIATAFKATQVGATKIGATKVGAIQVGPVWVSIGKISID